MRPNFLVIGAAKAATTSLCFHLASHPRVFMCRPKEPFFFCHDHVYARGWAWYESLFSEAVDETAIGEGTTVYSQTGTFPKTVDRIAEHLPDARLIYITRHPLERLESMWMQLTSQSMTNLPFAKALRREPAFIDSSLYWRQLSAYRLHFPDDRILLLFYEDFRRDAAAVLRECFRFLDVDPACIRADAARPRHASAGKRRDRALAFYLRRHLPFFDQLRTLAPSRARALAVRMLRSPIRDRPQWDPATRAWVLGEIRADNARFLEFCGRPADFWKLETP